VSAGGARGNGRAGGVVVTGMGCVTPVGGDAPGTWRSLLEGRSGVRPITRFDASGFPTTFAGEIDELPRLRGQFAATQELFSAADLWDRKSHLLLGAAQEAWEQAGAGTGGAGGGGGRAAGFGLVRPERLGLCVGSEGGRKLLEDVAARSIRFRREPTLEPVIPAIPRGEAARQRPSHPTRLLASALSARGPAMTVCTACTSSGGAVAEALWMLRRGAADVIVAAGTDTLVEAFMLSGFSLLGALSRRNDDPAGASRPFDVDRDGFVLSEGAGALVLETEEHARARGAAPLGRLLGAGMSNNAYRVTDSPPDGAGPFLAMRDALTDAGLEPGDVGYVNAHGTSTEQNDVSEARALRRALSGAVSQVPVSSTKSMIGHLVAACGAVEAVVCLCSLRDGLVHATRNLSRPDPDCELDHVIGSPRRIAGGAGVALSNSFGFGGSNATLVLGAP
jgi:3-oxoacyl-[acyl-carrier-protein] synthase II